MFKKLSLFFISILVILSFTTFSFADNEIRFEDVTVSVKEEEVTVNAKVTGYVDNIPFCVKVLSDDGSLRYIDYVYANNNFINITFVPMECKEGDSLILKITGVTTTTKTFRYSEVGTNDEVLDDRYVSTLETIKGFYSKYEDLVGSIEFDMDLDKTDDYIKITLKGKTFKSTDNVWRNKDSARWNSFLKAIADIAIKNHNMDVRIRIFDSSKKLVDNKVFDSEGEWGQNIPNLITQINSSYNSIKLGGKTYKVKFARGDVDQDFYTGDILFIDTTITGFDFKKIKDEEKQELQDYFDKIYSKVREKCFYDTTFRVYNSSNNLYNTYVYFSTSEPEGNEYKPLDYSNANLPINMMNYGKNSVVIPTSDFSISTENNYYELTLSDTSNLMSTISALNNSQKGQVVFAYDALTTTDHIKMIVAPSVLKVLKSRNIDLTFNNTLMQITVPSEALNTSSSIIFDVQEIPKEYEYDPYGINYNVSLTYADGSEVTGNKIVGVYRLDDKFQETLSDIRKVNIMHCEYKDFYEETTMLTASYDSGVLGLAFRWNGNGYYRAEENLVTFADMESHWAKDVVEVIASKGIVNGVGYGCFDPDETLSRAHYVTIISRHLGLIASGANHFTDVYENDYYYNHVNAAYDSGILPPTMTGEKFNPDDAITREEMAYITMMAYMMVTGEKLSGGTPLFEDAAEISSWAKDYIAMAQYKKIINGFPNGNVGPKSHATRAEACQIVFNLLREEGGI